MSETESIGGARRAALQSEIQDQTGIDEFMIERLIRGFYARVQSDSVIGPVFKERIDDWEPHLQRMFAFWSSVSLMSGRYHGQPMVKHLRLPIDARHFDRWLSLFEQTAWELCPAPAAERFILLAKRIGRSLQLGVASAHGVVLVPAERFHVGAPQSRY